MAATGFPMGIVRPHYGMPTNRFCRFAEYQGTAWHRSLMGRILFQSGKVPGLSRGLSPPKPIFSSTGYWVSYGNCETAFWKAHRSIFVEDSTKYHMTAWPLLLAAFCFNLTKYQGWPGTIKLHPSSTGYRVPHGNGETPSWGPAGQFFLKFGKSTRDSLESQMHMPPDLLWPWDSCIARG